MGAEGDPIDRVGDGRAGEEFCDQLESAGAVVLSESSPRIALDRAEGWRSLTRLTRAALEAFLEACDAQAPAFRGTAGETGKMGMDGPGVPNWLETCGHRQGTLSVRWIRAREHPQPQTRVVKLSELRGG